MATDKSERKICRRIGGKLTRASGAVFDDADILFGDCVIEVKRRDTSNSCFFSFAVWEKLYRQALKKSKRPILVYQVRDVRLMFGSFFDLEHLIRSVGQECVSIEITTKSTPRGFRVYADKIIEMMCEYTTVDRIAILKFCIDAIHQTPHTSDVACVNFDYYAACLERQRKCEDQNDK